MSNDKEGHFLGTGVPKFFNVPIFNHLVDFTKETRRIPMSSSNFYELMERFSYLPRVRTC